MLCARPVTREDRMSAGDVDALRERDADSIVMDRYDRRCASSKCKRDQRNQTSSGKHGEFSEEGGGSTTIDKQLVRAYRPAE